MHPVFADYTGSDPRQALLRMTEQETTYEPALRALFVNRYDLVRELLTASSLQSARLVDPLLEALPPEAYRLHRPIKDFFRLWPVFAHGDYHHRVRAVLRPALRAEAVRLVVEQAPFNCRQLLTQVSGRGWIDWTDEVARPYAIMVLADLFGLPPEGVSEFIGPAEDVIRYLGRPLALHDNALATSTSAAIATLRTLVADHLLPRPRSPLTAALLELSENPALGVEVAVAVTTQIVTGTLDPMVTLATEAVLVHSTAVEPADSKEILRLACPFRFAPRYVSEPMVIDGHQLDRGDRVILGLGSANVDASRFPEPLTHHESRKTPHLAFGLGGHYCLGAPVARGALEALVTELTTGPHRVEVDAASLRRARDLSISKVEALRVRVR